MNELINFWNRVGVTACNAESWPTKLKVFRNYESPKSLLEGCPEPPDDECLWSAARATGAAPTFFRFVSNYHHDHNNNNNNNNTLCNFCRPYKKYLDGAVMANNPTLDLMTEITEYNAAMEVCT